MLISHAKKNKRKRKETEIAKHTQYELEAGG